MRSPHPRDGARARDRRGVSFGERARSKSQTLNVDPARAGGYPVSRPAEIAARARPSGAGTDARARRGRPRGRPRADEPEASTARDPRRRARPAAASLFVDDHQFLSYRRGQQAGDRVVASSDFARREFAAADAEARTLARASRAARGDQRVRRARVGRRALAAAVVVVAAPGCSAQTVFTTLADLKNAVSSCASPCDEASAWDVSQLTSLNGAFGGSGFNADISGWDVSRVTDMEGTFEYALEFDQDISGWDVSSVTTMKNMFKSASQFDQNIGAWNVSSVTNMEGMFETASEFDRSIGAWDVSSVTTMERMFYQTWKFDQDIGAWDVSSVTTMEEMFYSAGKFNQNISAWDVSSVTTMRSMFEMANEFSRAIKGWNTAALVDSADMFEGAWLFTQFFSRADGSTDGPPSAWTDRYCPEHYYVKNGACEQCPVGYANPLGQWSMMVMVGTTNVPVGDDITSQYPQYEMPCTCDENYYRAEVYRDPVRFVPTENWPDALEVCMPCPEGYTNPRQTEYDTMYGWGTCGDWIDPAYPFGSESSDSSLVAPIAAAIALLTPTTAFGIMFAFFKPALRRVLLRCGLRRFADMVVPDLKGDVRAVSRKLDGLELNVEAFLAKQKLPRLVDVTPEIPASKLSLDGAEVLGSGGYGAVYKTSYNGSFVAVKALFAGGKDSSVPANIAKMMRREATIMCSLNHPNILRVHGVVSARGWIVMDLCEGGALDEALKDPEQAFDDATQTRLCAEVATGVAYLHMKEVSIVHGDMKAGNVLLTRDRSARLCDFGLSEAKNRSKTMTSAANAGATESNALTVAWSAPELFTAEPKSFATDVYALGLTLWEIYERATPFASMPEAAVVNQVLSGRRPKLAKTPESTRPLVEACWSEDPKERPGADRVALMLTNLWTNHPDHEPTKSGDETEISEGPPSAGEKKKKSDEKAAAKKKAEAKKKEEEAAAKEARDAEAAVSDLLSRLRRWRDGDAATRGTAAFDDATLGAIAAARPRSLAELGKVRGVGAEKALEHGEDVLAVVRGQGSRATEEIDVRVE